MSTIYKKELLSNTNLANVAQAKMFLYYPIHHFSIQKTSDPLQEFFSVINVFINLMIFQKSRPILSLKLTILKIIGKHIENREIQFFKS